MEIQFDISHQHLVVQSGYYVVSNSENYITAKFTFSDDWDDITKTAVFRQSGADESSAVSVELTGSTCDVPEEALKYPGMRVYITGSDGTTVIHTNAELIKIVKSGSEDTDDITGGASSGSDAQGGAVIVVDDIISPESNNPVSSKTLWKEFAKKVSKVEGMGLSENSYTTEEKTKLGSIAEGAEVNVQSDWGQDNESADDYIKNKPTKLSQFVNDSGYTTSDDLSSLSQGITNVSTALSNHQSATVLPHSDGSVTTDKLADGAVTAEKIAYGVLFSGKYGDLTGVPTEFLPSGHRHTVGDITDLPEWVNNPAKPTYTANEVGALAADGTAVRASADADGNNIPDTYATKAQMDGLSGDVIEVKGEVGELKSDLDKLENEIYFDSEYQTDVTSNGTLDTTKQLQLNLKSNIVVLINGTKGVIKFSVRSGEKYSIDGISECSSDPTYPTVTLAFTSDETTLITSSDGGYSYDLDATSVTDVKNYIVTVPNNAKYMYVSNRGKNGAKVRIIKKTTNNLTGKKLGILGDSIAYGYGFDGGFGGIIANNNGMTIQNVAVGGACISVGMKRSDNTDIPCIYDQVELLDDDCDIVVFDGCFNDRGIIEDGRTTLGTITSIGWFGTNAPDTFCHCFENLLEALVQKFHGKPILYVYHHPIQRAKDTVHESVLQMLEKWSIPYVDLSNASGGMITQIGTIKNTYTVGDTVHPNELGYKKYYVPQITAKMKTLL